MNYVNFLKHTISTPDIYHRRYDLDLKGIPEEPTQINQAKRIALVALPFLSLYRPIGSAMSLGMGSFRVFSHLNLSLALEQKKEWGHLSKEVVETALAVFSLAATIFSFSIGLAVITGIDTGKGLIHIVQFCLEKEFSKAGEEVLQTLANGFYLGFMATGALEMILIFTVIQGFTCLYQARGDIAEGRYLEAGAKLAMAGIRFNQANQYKELIERRNALFAMQKYQALVIQAMKGKAVRHLVNHSLVDLNGEIDINQVILSNQEEDYDFGSHFHGFGKGLIKGANIAFRKTIVDGKEVIECEFKVNHVHRERLQKMINDFSKLSNKEIKEILQFTGSHAENIQIEKPGANEFFWFDEDLTIAYKVNITGLGSVSFGGSTDLPNLYDKVVIRMDQNKTLYDLHELMALTNLDEALCVSSSDDLTRLKIGHLFRTFFPREATPFERTEDFFTLSTEQLKAEIIKKAPQMKELFDAHLSHMTTTEILPGRVRYQINGLAEKVHELGGRALTAAVTGYYSDDQELYKRVAGMLTMGMISQELRDNYGLSSSGYGGSYFHGGADAVYTQMITEQLAKTDPTLSSLQYYSKVRMLISLDALETGTYQYFNDDYGTRIYGKDSPWGFWKEDLYAERPDILELTTELQSEPVSSFKWGKDWAYDGHEIMLKERIDPSFFQGIMVDQETTRNGLLEYLRSCNLVQKDITGNETILGIATDLFIRVGKDALANV